MFFAYFDESGDTGNQLSPTQAFALSCVLIHDRDWLSALDQTIAFRRFLHDKFHISPRSELKATWLVHNKGDMRASGLSYPGRLAAYRAVMRRTAVHQQLLKPPELGNLDSAPEPTTRPIGFTADLVRRNMLLTRHDTS